MIFYSFYMLNLCASAALRSPATCLLLPEFQTRQCISLHLSFPFHPRRRQRMAALLKLAYQLRIRTVTPKRGRYAPHKFQQFLWSLRDSPLAHLQDAGDDLVLII